MPAELLLQRLRRFLLGLAIFICMGTIVELWLSDHDQQTLQYIPFVLSTLGLLVSGVVLFRPNRNTIRALRMVMPLVALGSLAGIGLHLRGNFAFEMDIRPNATASEVLMDALKGAAPLLAPGIMALAAALALAATTYHPVLQDKEAD